MLILIQTYIIDGGFIAVGDIGGIMPLPGSLTTITVSGTYLKFDGTPESGVVQFVNQAFLQSASDNIIVAYGTTTVTLDANGAFTAVLPATNDPEWVPIGFTYNVYERLSTARRSYVISAL